MKSMDYMTILICFKSLFTLNKLRQPHAFPRSPNMKTKRFAICVISDNGVGRGAAGARGRDGAAVIV